MVWMGEIRGPFGAVCGGGVRVGRSALGKTVFPILTCRRNELDLERAMVDAHMRNDLEL